MNKIELEQIDFADSDSGSRQNALNAFTNSASAENEYILTKDTATGNIILKALNIAANFITNAMLAKAGANTYKGNNTGESANVSDISTNTAFNRNFETSVSNIKSNSSNGSVGSLDTIARADHIHPIPAGTSISVKNASTQSIDGNVISLVTFPTINYDVNSEFSSNTFTSKANQTILIHSSIEYTIDTLSPNNVIRLFIYKNDVQVIKFELPVPFKSSIYTPNIQISVPIKVEIDDTINIYTEHTDSISRNLNGNQKLNIEKIC